ICYATKSYIAADSVPLLALCYRLAGPGERRFRSVRDERRSRVQFGDLWIRLGDFLSWFLSVWDSKEHTSGAGRRAGLDRANHGNMGPDFRGIDVCAHPCSLLPATIPSWRR